MPHASLSPSTSPQLCNAVPVQPCPAVRRLDILAAWLVESLPLSNVSRAHGVVASHPLRMRKALGSNPSVSIQGTLGLNIGAAKHFPLAIAAPPHGRRDPLHSTRPGTPQQSARCIRISMCPRQGGKFCCSDVQLSVHVRGEPALHGHTGI